MLRQRRLDEVVNEDLPDAETVSVTLTTTQDEPSDEAVEEPVVEAETTEAVVTDDENFNAETEEADEEGDDDEGDDDEGDDEEGDDEEENDDDDEEGDDEEEETGDEDENEEEDNEDEDEDEVDEQVDGEVNVSDEKAEEGDDEEDDETLELTNSESEGDDFTMALIEEELEELEEYESTNGLTDDFLADTFGKSSFSDDQMDGDENGSTMTESFVNPSNEGDELNVISLPSNDGDTGYFGSQQQQHWHVLIAAVLVVCGLAMWTKYWKPNHHRAEAATTKYQRRLVNGKHSRLPTIDDDEKSVN